MHACALVCSVRACHDEKDKLQVSMVTGLNPGVSDNVVVLCDGLGRGSL